MRDMRGLRDSDVYKSTLEHFKDTNPCQHNIFKNLHMERTENRCPICECLIDGSVPRKNKENKDTLITATIDHFRPTEYYPNFKCEDKNYLLLCSDCNNVLKKSLFPLYGSQIRATTISDTSMEKPLLVNPIDDDIEELFTLLFILRPDGSKILELAIHPTLAEESYLYEKAKKSIEIFKLGECHTSNSTNNVQICRIGILRKHFEDLYEIALAFKNNSSELRVLLQEYKTRNNKHGFMKFIKNKNFKIIIPQG